MTRGSGSATYDVLGIGNAIVDVLAHADDAFLARHGLAKGTMTLIDAERADALYDAHGPGRRDLGRLGGQHHGGRRVARRPRRLHRQGARRPARRGLHPRHPRRRRRTSTTPPGAPTARRRRAA